MSNLVERLEAWRVAQATRQQLTPEQARAKEELKRVAVSAEWSLDLAARDGRGWPGRVVQRPPGDGRLRVSQRLADVTADNARFAATRARDLLRMPEHERPVYRSAVFGIVDHPDAGCVAVTDEEFHALGLPLPDVQGVAYGERGEPM